MELDSELGATGEVDAKEKVPGAHRDDAGDDDQQRDQEEPVPAADNIQAAHTRWSRDLLRSLLLLGLFLLIFFDRSLYVDDGRVVVILLRLSARRDALGVSRFEHDRLQAAWVCARCPS